MKVRFYVGVGIDGAMKPRVLNVADALKIGAKLFGDEVELIHNGAYDRPGEDVDVACCWGIMGNSRQILDGYLAAGKRVLFFDKALIRRLGNERQGHFRVGIDGPSPVKYLMRTPKSWERWEGHRIAVLPKQKLIDRGALVYAGSSQKYCDFYDLGDANEYAESIFQTIRQHTNRLKMIYRPKPSWPDFREILGTRHSPASESLIDLLRATHVLVTHGSAAAVEAIVMGVPAITLGPCAAEFVAGHSLEQVRDPLFYSQQARWQFCCQLAHCQWTAEELASGEAWGFIRGEIEATK